jgi:hypothetical protein
MSSDRDLLVGESTRVASRGSYSKKPLEFLGFNPQPRSVIKPSQSSPGICRLVLVLSKIFGRSPQGIKPCKTH